MSEFPVPEITERTAPYWKALSEGCLVFQRCKNCGHAWLPPRTECSVCLCDEVAWEAASGGGRVVSWVIYHHAFNSAFRDRLPYNVVLVELDEGPRLISNIVNEGDGLAIEKRVELVLEQEHGVAVARFRLV